MKLSALICVLLLLIWQASSSYYEEDDIERNKQKENNFTENATDKTPSPDQRRIHIKNNHESEAVKGIRNKISAHKLPLVLADLEVKQLSEDENASIDLMKACALLKTENKKSPIFKFKKLSEKPFKELTKEEKESLVKLLEHNEIASIFEQLKAASQKDQFNHNIDYSSGLSTPLGHLTMFRSLHRMNNLKMKLLSESGDSDAALQSLKTGLKTASMTSDGMTIIGELVQASLYSSYFKEMKTLNYDNELYNLLNTELKGSHARELSTFDSERIFGDQIFDTLLNDRESEISKNELLKDLSEEVIHNERRHYLECLLQLRLNLAEKGPDLLDDINAMESSVDKNMHPITSMILPSYSGILKKYYQRQDTLKLNMLSMKIKEHKETYGEFPQSLEELSLAPELITDTINRESFTYSISDNSIVLESTKSIINSEGKIKVEFTK
jgi:hypothetical protein